MRGVCPLVVCAVLHLGSQKWFLWAGSAVRAAGALGVSASEEG